MCGHVTNIITRAGSSSWARPGLNHALKAGSLNQVESVKLMDKEKAGPDPILI